MTSTEKIEYESMVNRLDKVSKFYNMKAICELAGVSYDTYKGWKYKGKQLSMEKVEALLRAMKYAYISL